MAKSVLDSGQKFKTLKSKLAGRGVQNPTALAAFIGRKKYGKKKFQSLKGKKSSSSPSMAQRMSD